MAVAYKICVRSYRLACDVLCAEVVRCVRSDHYVPPTFFIDSVGISSSKVYNEFCNISFGESNIVEFDDEESIKAITDYHSL